MVLVLLAVVDENALVGLSVPRLLLYLALRLAHTLIHSAVTGIADIVVLLQVAVDLHLLLEELVQFGLDAVDEFGHFVEEAARVEAVGSDEVGDVGVVVGELKIHCFLYGYAQREELAQLDLLFLQLLLLHQEGGYLVDRCPHHTHPLASRGFLPQTLEPPVLVGAEFGAAVQHLGEAALVGHFTEGEKKYFAQSWEFYRIVQNMLIKMQK